MANTESDHAVGAMPVSMSATLLELGCLVPTQLAVLSNLNHGKLQARMDELLSPLSVQIDIEALVAVMKASELLAAMLKAQLAVMRPECMGVVVDVAPLLSSLKFVSAQAVCWPARRARPIGRLALTWEEAEAKERLGWPRRLVIHVMGADLPIVLRAAHSVDMARTLSRMVRGRRGRTLRAHAMAGEHFAHWLLEARDVRWPRCLREVLGYVEVRHQEPRGIGYHSVTSMAGVSLERAGEISAEYMFSRSPAFGNLMDGHIAERSAGACPTREAPLLPIVLIVAMDLVVVDGDRPLFERAFAWYRLVRVLGCRAFWRHGGGLSFGVGARASRLVRLCGAV
jgi:hypothetical protein